MNSTVKATVGGAIGAGIIAGAALLYNQSTPAPTPAPALPRIEVKVEDITTPTIGFNAVQSTLPTVAAETVQLAVPSIVTTANASIAAPAQVDAVAPQLATLASVQSGSVQAASTPQIVSLPGATEYSDMAMLKQARQQVADISPFLDQLGLPHATGQRRALPPFFQAVFTYDNATQAALKTDLKIAVFWPRDDWSQDSNGSSNAMAASIAQSGKPVILVSVWETVPASMLRVAGLPNVAAIVLGHGLSADRKGTEYPALAADLLQSLRVLRKITDAPILLSVSLTNAHDPAMALLPNRSWIDAFGSSLNEFDGFALHQINGFAWFEEGTLSSARATLGLPADKPVVLWEFVGSKTVVDDHARQMWARSWPNLLVKIQLQGWAGVVLYTWPQTPEDAAFKAQIIKGQTP